MSTFDPVAYKRTTHRQWDEAAEAWHRWGPVLESWLGDATERMLDATGVGAGGGILDVAAGAGGQTLAAARRVGPAGRVVATDISAAILAYAAETAAEAGLSHVSTLEADGEALDDLEPESFDAAISRVGLIYFPDQQRALAGIRRALRPGGRFAAIVYSTPDRNAFFSVPVGIIRRRAQLPPPLPGQPGPFSLGGPGVLERTLTDAGFTDVTVEAVESPLRLPAAEDCVRFERESFGALHQMLAGVPEEERPDVWAEIQRALGEFETADGFVGPCELLVAAGSRCRCGWQRFPWPSCSPRHLRSVRPGQATPRSPLRRSRRRPRRRGATRRDGLGGDRRPCGELSPRSTGPPRGSSSRTTAAAPGPLEPQPHRTGHFREAGSRGKHARPGSARRDCSCAPRERRMGRVTAGSAAGDGCRVLSLVRGAAQAHPPYGLVMSSR